MDSSSIVTGIVQALKDDSNVTDNMENDGEGNLPIYDKWEMGDPSISPRIIVSVFGGRSEPAAVNMDEDQDGTRATWEFPIVQVDIWDDDQAKVNTRTDQVKRCLMQKFDGFTLGNASTVALNQSQPVEYRNAIRYTGFYILRSNKAPEPEPDPE